MNWFEMPYTALEFSKMADATFFRVALRFRQYDRTWWEVFGSGDTEIATIKPKLLTVVTAALAFRHPAVYCSNVRISNPLAARQADVVRLNIAATPVGTTVPSPTSESVNYQLQANTVGVKRTIWFRGLKASQLKRTPSNGQDYLDGDLPTLITAYYEACRAANFGIPSLFPVDNGDNRRWSIDSITVLPQKKIKINFTGAPVWGSRNRVLIYKVPQRMFPGLNGQWTTTHDATGFIPIGFESELPVDTYPISGGAFRKAEYRFSVFAEGGSTFLNIDKRDTRGGPLDARGRSKTKIKRSR